MLPANVPNLPKLTGSRQRHDPCAVFSNGTFVEADDTALANRDPKEAGVGVIKDARQVLETILPERDNQGERLAMADRSASLIWSE